MNTIRLGNSDICISPVGLGCMGFSHAYGSPMEKHEAARIIRSAYDMGYTLFDTAQRYVGTNPDGSTSYNEEMVGEALKGIRDKVVIATKCGISLINGQRTPDARPETIRTTLEASLKRLQTDYVDLFYLHTPDPNTPIEVVAETMRSFYEQGKIRAWGVSQVDEDLLRRAHKIFPVSAIQNRYSIMARAEERIFPVCRELGITFVAFSPLANGFLSGAYNGTETYNAADDFRARMPQFTAEGYKGSEELLNYLRGLAAEKNTTLSQISLAWMQNKDPRIVPIPGSRKPDRMLENFNSCKIELTTAEVQAIDESLGSIQIGPVFLGSNRKS